MVVKIWLVKIVCDKQRTKFTEIMETNPHSTPIIDEAMETAA
jgi:hypothetical protein